MAGMVKCQLNYLNNGRNQRAMYFISSFFTLGVLLLCVQFRGEHQAEETIVVQMRKEKKEIVSWQISIQSENVCFCQIEHFANVEPQYLWIDVSELHKVEHVFF